MKKDKYLKYTLGLIWCILAFNSYATDSVCNPPTYAPNTLYHQVFLYQSENLSSSYVGVYGDASVESTIGGDHEWGLAYKTYPGATHYFVWSPSYSFDLFYGASAMISFWIPTGDYHGAYTISSGTGDDCITGAS